MNKKSFRTLDYLEHIVEAIDRIIEYTNDVGELGFLNNKLIQDAVIRNLEIIGEASQNITRYDSTFVDVHPSYL